MIFRRIKKIEINLLLGIRVDFSESGGKASSWHLARELEPASESEGPQGGTEEQRDAKEEEKDREEPEKTTPTGLEEVMDSHLHPDYNVVT